MSRVSAIFWLLVSYFGDRDDIELDDCEPAGLSQIATAWLQ